MKIAILWILAVTFAYNTTRPGAMYISRIKGLPSHLSLLAEDDQMYARSKRSEFDYFGNGSVKLADETKYLSVAPNGKFILADIPHYGFNLSIIEGITTMRTMTYKGSNLFDLCADNLIGYMSGCEGAEHAVITFEDILPPVFQ